MNTVYLFIFIIKVCRQLNADRHAEAPRTRRGIDMGDVITDAFILWGREVVCGLIVADYVRLPQGEGELAGY